eukprot:Tamp_16865.p2 GENE.Tamp_16865~~Tamp_16865.p2  ORF type:complete len:103 (-),score=5.87 Tamp_16865:265-573(-)
MATARATQANPAERANRQVLEALRTSVETVTAFEDWDLALPEICFGLNNSVASATGMSPFELAHGFEARTRQWACIVPFSVVCSLQFLLCMCTVCVTSLSLY